MQHFIISQSFTLCLQFDRMLIIGYFGTCRLPQPCWLVRSSHCEQLVYLVNDQSLSVSSFNLTQEEFVGKVCILHSLCIYLQRSKISQM